MIDLRPDLVVLDILDTDSELVVRFREAGVKVVSFEDLGEGSQHTDLTINELYDAPQRAGSHYRWGHKYYFVRDEFNTARRISCREKVQGLLLTFGGTDQHNLSKKIFRQVCQFCEERKIHIYIVTGPGYQEFKELENSNMLETQSLNLDSSKAIKKLDWQPKLKIDEALKLTYDWFSESLNQQDMREFSLQQITDYQINA